MVVVVDDVLVLGAVDAFVGIGVIGKVVAVAEALGVTTVLESISEICPDETS